MHVNRLLAVTTLLFWFVTPDILCLLPGIELTPSEEECCRLMAGKCDGREMPDHSCCKSIDRPDTGTLTKSLQWHLAHAIVNFALPADEIIGTPTFILAEDAAIHSPPGSPGLYFTVLRI